MVETDIDDDYIDEVCNELMIMMAMFVMMKLCVGTVILNDDDDDDDDIAVVIMMMTTTMMTQMMRFCLGGTVDLN